uniref:MULE transposase domain-containing protein n=1 Tax=Lactuca sativa TaxID=4236 RepID=A0A9R1W7Q7_LACSA|nr:hypothetical protein LSAT_V11C300154020 [Lactuca sativa]
MDAHTEGGGHADFDSMQDGIDHTYHDSLVDDQHHGIDQNPGEDCDIYDNIDEDVNDLHDISIEEETLGGFDDNQSNDNHQHSNHRHVIINEKQYWIPKVPDEVKPKLKAITNSLIHGSNRSLSVFLIRTLVPPKLKGSLLLLMVDKYIIGGTVDDLKNLMRDINYIIGGTDAQIINNHKKCVTFGAGFLSKEEIDSYTWLLKSFLKAFGKQPILVLSDEDPAMKNAIAKVSLDIVNDEEFKLQFNSLILNSKLEEKDFEQGWKALLDEHDLNDNTWLRRMYNLRHSWITTFFKRVHMSGFMRTTSRSESQNSTFHQNTHYGSTLVNFIISFESATKRPESDIDSDDDDDDDKLDKLIKDSIYTLLF